MRGSIPEEEVSAKEMRRVATALIAEMPTSWRRALEFCRVEGLSKAAAAQVLGASEQEIENWLVQVDTFLQAKLTVLRLTTNGLDIAITDNVLGEPPPARQPTRDFDAVTGRGAPT